MHKQACTGVGPTVLLGYHNVLLSVEAHSLLSAQRARGLEITNSNAISEPHGVSRDTTGGCIECCYNYARP